MLIQKRWERAVKTWLSLSSWKSSAVDPAMRNDAMMSSDDILG